MRRYRFGAFLIVLGIVHLLCAGALVGYNLLEQSRAGESSREALDSIREMIPQAEKPTAARPLLPSVTLPPEEIPDYILNPEMDLPEAVVYGIPYIGYLSIPSLGLELPIISQTTGSNLQIAPCRYRGSPYQKNLVLGAHNYVTHFGNIGDLAYGDSVTFTDMDGNLFSYEVASIEILQPNQVDYLCSGDWPLTLYTCTLGGRTRVTVRCTELTES